MASRLFIAGMAAALAIAGAACGSSETAKEEATPAASTESHEGHQVAKVYFKEPKNGATVSSKSTLKFVFGADNYQISAVPSGEVKEARPAMGHFHLGVNTDCLPAGTVIPKAEEGDKPGTAGKWVHFGKGTDTFEMALNPGDYKFSVEVGDDLHRAVEGMCETINVKVE